MLSLACCHVHHLLVTELPAEHLGVGDRPVHGHEPGTTVPEVAAEGEDARLEENILDILMENTEIRHTLIGFDALTSAKGLFTNIFPFSTSFIFPELLLKD